MKNFLFLLLFLSISIKAIAQPPEPPTGFRWVLYEQYSDEFNGNSLDATKWQNSFLTGWQGRPPAKFEPTAVSVQNGTLQLKSGKYETPQGNYTMYGGAVTSLNETAHYGYYEVKFKTSKLAMSTTFWLSNSKQSYNPTACTTDTYSQELDIAEAVGDTRSQSSSFRTKQKSNTHYRYISCGETDETFYSNGADSALLSSEVWEDYHTYGMQWHDANSATFYSDGRLGDTVSFNTTIDANPFDRPMFIAMVTETYNWLTPYPTDAELDDDNINTAYYDWVRSYRLVPIFDAEPGIVGSPIKAEIFTEAINFNETPTITNGNQSLNVSYNYKANLNREIQFYILDSDNNEVYTTTVNGLEGYGNHDLTLSIGSALPNDSYKVVADIRPVGGTDAQIINATNPIAIPSIRYSSLPTEISSIGTQGDAGYGTGALKTILTWTGLTAGDLIYNQLRDHTGTSGENPQVYGYTHTVMAGSENGSIEIPWGFYGAHKGTLIAGNNANLQSQSTNSGVSNISASIPVVDNITRWNGNTDTNWNNSGNWDNDIPTASLQAIIPNVTNKPIASGSVNAIDITIQQGSSLTVAGTVTNTGTITIQSGASLKAGSVSGIVTYNRSLTFDTDKTKAWHLVSSPVTGETYDTNWIDNNFIAQGSNNNRGIATYNNSVANNNWSYFQTDATAVTFDSGKGYSIKRRKETGDISFTGTYTAGPKTIGITQSTSNYNLIGNPYTAYVNLGTFFTDNPTSSVLSESTIWLWNAATEEYEPKTSNLNNTFQIAPGQAFFVNAGVDTDVTFSLANQSHQTDTFLKNFRQEIQLNISQDGNSKKTKIYYINGTTTGFDNGYDASLFGETHNNLAVFTELVANNVGKKLAIQSLPDSNYENMIVPIGVIAKAGKEITFSASTFNLPEGIKVYLEDKETKTFTYLEDINNSLKVTLTDNVNGIGRFFLHTKSSILHTKNINLENISIYKSNLSSLKITGLTQGKYNFKLFNILGKQIMRTSFTADGIQEILLPNVAKGIYIVKLNTENGELFKKIIVD